MRSFIILLFPIFLAVDLSAQTKTAAQSDTLAGYQKNPYIPAFRIQTPDGSWFSKADLKTGKPTLILYFSPDCGHCQVETESLLSKMKEFNNLQIVMVTSRPVEDMKNFAEHYMIKRFPTIKIGSDPARLVTTFYDVKFTPFSALYDKTGKLIKGYPDGINMEEMSDLIK